MILPGTLRPASRFWRPAALADGGRGAPRPARALGRTLRLGALRKLGQPLLHQQLWCWGQDILHPAGNLLLRYGGHQDRPPTGLPGSTCYRLGAPGGQIILWGFGLWYEPPEGVGVFLPRQTFRPQLGAVLGTQAVWQPGMLRGICHPRDAADWRTALRLTAEACAWIAEYEQWCREAVGVEWRGTSLIRWDRPIVAPQRTAAAWHRMAGVVRAAVASLP